MLSILLRHYRRFAIFSIGMALFSVTIALGFGTAASHLNILLVFVTALISFCLVGVALYSARPRQRGILEIAGISAILSGFIMIYLPQPGLVSGLTGIAIFTGLMTAIWFFFQSELAERIGQRGTWTDRHSGPIPFPARLVWKHLIPGVAEPEDHCTGMLESFEEDADDPTTLNVTFKARGDRRSYYSLTFLERTKPSVCRFFFQGEEADGTIVDGILAIHITAIDDHNCFLAANEERRGLSLGAMVERWFDDALGYQYDRLLNLLHRRYGNAQNLAALRDLDDE